MIEKNDSMNSLTYKILIQNNSKQDLIAIISMRWLTKDNKYSNKFLVY